MKEPGRQPLVLVTNDDGYGTPGIEAMVAALEAWATVLVIAPTHEQSACSHKFTLGRSLRWKKVGERRFSIEGTPADCVYLGVFGGERVAPRVPDLVVSGLNAGLNLGLDTYYSGTVAGAREAAMRGVPGMAVSAAARTDLGRAARVCSDLAKNLLEVLDVPQPVVLNVNVPAGGSWELRRTRLGRRVYGEGVEFRRDPRGREYLWLGGPGAARDDLSPGTDTHAVQAGAIGVTALPLMPCERDSDAIVDAVLRAFEATDEKGSER
jgi:5'-nucleotidase